MPAPVNWRLVPSVRGESAVPTPASFSHRTPSVEILPETAIFPIAAQAPRLNVPLMFSYGTARLAMLDSHSASWEPAKHTTTNAKDTLEQVC